MSQDEARIEALVFGRVQGVGFRYFAVDQASLRGLKGWARNLSDGTVQVIAQGPRESVERFLEDLRQAPLPIQVTHIDAKTLPAEPSLGGFTIRR